MQTAQLERCKCGRKRDKPNRKTCQACIDRGNRNRIERIKKGYCGWCPNKRQEGSTRTLCKDCADGLVRKIRANKGYPLDKPIKRKAPRSIYKLPATSVIMPTEMRMKVTDLSDRLGIPICEVIRRAIKLYLGEIDTNEKSRIRRIVQTASRAS